MRIQQKENNIYIKTLDNVDSYLVNIINRYFNNNQDDIRLNIENIINETIKRIKEDIDNIIKDIIINNTVTSVNHMNGDVILDHTHVGAEPVILNKGTAFNKNFGNETDTICAGDDPRLSDSRTPLQHDHDEYITPLDLETVILTVLASKGLSINNSNIIITNKNLEIINGELVEK